MMRVFRLQWMSVWRFLALTALAVLLLFVMSLLYGARSIFGTYFVASTGFVTEILTILGLVLGRSVLNLAISLGGTRREYFLSTQAMFFVCALLGWAMTTLIAAAVGRMGWDMDGLGTLFSALATPESWQYLTVALASMAVGTLSGMLLTQGGRVLGVFCLTVGIAGAYILTLLLAMGLGSLRETDFVPVLTVLSILIFAAVDALLYRKIRTAVVR